MRLWGAKMRYIFINIICLALFSVSVNSSDNILKGNQKAFKTYQRLVHFQEGVTAYKSYYKRLERPSIASYRAYRKLLDGMKVLYSDCPAILEYIEKGDHIIEMVNSRSLDNSVIIDFYIIDKKELALGDCRIL